MPSQFDQFVLPQTSYIPEYQGMPLAQLESSAKRLEDTYLKNLASANQMDIMNAERQAIAGDQGLNQQVAQEYAGVVDQMAQEGDYEHMSNRVAALARQYVRDPRIKAIQESRKNFEQEQTLAQQMMAKGMTPLFMGDPTTHQSYDPETGKANVYSPQVEQMLDYDGRRENIWKALNPDRFITGLTTSERKAMPEVIDQYLNYGMSEGIFDSKIAQNLENVMNSYRATPEYRQEMKKLLWENPGAQPEDVEAQIRRNVLDRGELRQYVKRSVQSLRPQDDGSGGGGLGSGYEEMSATNLKTEMGFDMDDFVSRERSDWSDIDSTERLAGVQAGTLAPNLEAAESDKYVGPNRYNTPEEKAAFDTAATAGIQIFAPDAISSGLTHSQKLEYAQKYTDLVQERMLNYRINTTNFDRERAEMQLKGSHVTQNDIQTQIETNIKNQLEQRAFYDMESGTTFTAKAAGGEFSDQFMDYIGDPDNITLAGELDPKNYITTASNNPEFADAYVINVRDVKAGKTRQILVNRQDSSRGNIYGQRAKEINNVYTSFSVKPNQQQEISIFGVPIVGKKEVGVDSEQNIYDKGITVSIQGSKPLDFKSEEALVDFIMGVVYGGQQ